MIRSVRRGHSEQPENPAAGHFSKPAGPGCRRTHRVSGSLARLTRESPRPGPPPARCPGYSLATVSGHRTEGPGLTGGQRLKFYSTHCAGGSHCGGQCGERVEDEDDGEWEKEEEDGCLRAGHGQLRVGCGGVSRKLWEEVMYWQSRKKDDRPWFFDAELQDKFDIPVVSAPLPTVIVLVELFASGSTSRIFLVEYLFSNYAIVQGAEAKFVQ
eukprot:754927-Hanusia_phi.AAC.1